MIFLSILSPNKLSYCFKQRKLHFFYDFTPPMMFSFDLFVCTRSNVRSGAIFGKSEYHLSYFSFYCARARNDKFVTCSTLVNWLRHQK